MKHQDQTENNADPKHKSNRNPLRWLVYFAVFDVFLSIFEICVVSLNLMEYRRGKLFILAPFQVLFMAVFLYLAIRRSKYAWHIFVLTTITYIPAFLILRPQNFFANNYSGVIATIIAGIVFLLYAWKIHKPYMEYVSSQ